MNATIAAAVANGSLGIALSDSGWMLPWYIGTLLVLQQLGIARPGATQLGAVSGGAIAAANLCAGVPPERAMALIQGTAAACRARAGCLGTLSAETAASLRASMPPDAHVRCAAGNATHIYISRPAAGPAGAALGPLIPGSTPEQVSTSSLDAFRDGVFTTSFIPFWADAGRATRQYLGKPGYEGVYALPMPCPPGVSVCLRLSARLAGPLAARPGPVQRALFRLPLALRPAPADLAPGMLTPIDLTPWEIGYQLALLPGTPEQLAYLFEKGQEDARAWARAALGAEGEAAPAPARGTSE